MRIKEIIAITWACAVTLSYYAYNSGYYDVKIRTFSKFVMGMLK